MNTNEQPSEVSNLPAGLFRWKLTPAKSESPSFILVAPTAASAWAKFVKQRFGALKPARSDWRVSAD